MSIWLFVAAFVVIGAIGLAALLVRGNPVDDTRLSAAPQRLLAASTTVPTAGQTSVAPTDGEDGEGLSTSGRSTDSKAPKNKSSKSRSSASKSSGGKAAKTKPSGGKSKDGKGGGERSGSVTQVTLPGGMAAPRGVRQVLRTNTSLSLTFEIPDNSGGPSPNAVIAPTTVTPAADGNSIKVTVGCAGSPDETLAQLSVSETDRLVTVAAVVLVPADATGCGNTKSREFVLPLSKPLGNRSVMAVPVGTELPELGLG